MPTARDIRRRIRSVRSTQQITRAMNMVAAAKLQRIQGRMLAFRRYADEIESLLNCFLAEVGTREHPLLDPRRGRRALLIVMTGDRGLCGAFNTNVIRRAQTYMAENPDKEFSIVAVGRKGHDFFRKRGRVIREFVLDPYDDISFHSARRLVERVTPAYLQDEQDEVTLIYSRFVSPLQQEFAVEPMLPFGRPEPPTEATGKRPERQVHIHEPSVKGLCARLLLRRLASQAYRALLESAASLHGARMAAMDMATENASDMIDRLTVQYNRARQAGITREILDIIGGADALQ